MHSISTNFESLTNVGHFNVTKSSSQRIISERMKENSCTVLVNW
jgi:hypothetical protein